MIKPFCLGLVVFVNLSSVLAYAKVQCSCPKVAADGEGNTSCSAAESKGRCTIDFNLFGQESEQRAAQLAAKHSGRNITAPPANLSPAASLKFLSTFSQNHLLDAILIYMIVAAGDQSNRKADAISLEGIADVAKALYSQPLAGAVTEAFSSAALERWSKPDVVLQQQQPPKNFNGATVSPGCIEFITKRDLWIMFKAAWSPARIVPRCGAN